MFRLRPCPHGPWIYSRFISRSRGDRSKQHLGASDIAIVTLRRLMLEAIRAVECGATPPGLDPQSHRDIRPYDAVITSNTPRQEAFASELVAKW